MCILKWITSAGLGLAFLGTVAHAQLMLSGHTTGSFVDLSEPNTTVNNASDGSFASFKTGIPAPGSFKSSIVFTNATFTNVNSGDPVQIGLFEVTNGTTLLGSGAPYATFNLGLELTSPAMQTLAMSQFTFTIDHTPNTPGAKPDTFSVAYDQPNSTIIDGYKVDFSVVMDNDFQLAEGATTTKGALYVTFTPVPEPATYALCGAALLGGLVAYRRFRPGKNRGALAA